MASSVSEVHANEAASCIGICVRCSLAIEIRQEQQTVTSGRDVRQLQQLPLRSDFWEQSRLALVERNQPTTEASRRL